MLGLKRYIYLAKLWPEFRNFFGRIPFLNPSIWVVTNQWGPYNLLRFIKFPGSTLPETNSSHLKMDGWNTSFLLASPIFRCELLVSGSVFMFNPYLQSLRHTQDFIWTYSDCPYYGPMVNSGVAMSNSQDTDELWTKKTMELSPCQEICSPPEESRHKKQWIAIEMYPWKSTTI